ncbi:helicase C-terminal domain-containing protein [Leptospirillum ferriphilum]|uniref:helicase C-terminal domain-containing protein n=1 Tax=Leptospirillum ferriphilum TaxID=178606 RepID=UPI0009872606|nr:helicase C-terminal domain-containing protein [Leptospirillum ferriphilum]OOH77737.1 hypothetical protein BOX30_09135 [Leptospirillum ferriphilum]
MKEKTLAQTLEALVASAFAPDGLLAKRGYPPRKPQAEMALRIARFLPGDRIPIPGNKPETGAKVAKVLPVEAETGIGKTMAYLLPVALYSALTGKRAAISTFTRFLQKEIVAGRDLSTALEIVRETTGRTLKVALRRGISNFVSPSKVEYLQALFQAEHPDWMKTPEGAFFCEFAAWARKGEPFDEWNRELPVAPDGARLTRELLCLRFDSPAEDRRAYEAHRILAKDADLVITTHITTLLNAKKGGTVLADDEDDGASTRPLSVLVADEADRLSSAAETLYAKKLRPQDLLSFCEAIKNFVPETEMSALLRATKTARKVLDERGRDSSFRSLPFLSLDAEDREKLLSWLKAVKGKGFRLSKNEALPPHLRFAAADYSEEAARLLSHHKATFANAKIMLEVSWSPLRREPGIGSLLLNPGVKINGLIYGVDRLVLTSGTLTGGLSDPDNDFRMKFGIPKGVHESVKENTFRPFFFGVLKSVVFADPSLPAPFLSEGEDARYNPDYLRYAAFMADQAAANGRTLALAASFRDIEEIEPFLTTPSSSLRLHRRNQSFADFWSSVEGDDRVRLALSPSPWEGANLRRDEAPWMDNLLVLRLPIPPISEAVWTRYKDEERDLFLHYQRAWETFRKVRQALGRGFRRPEDEVSWWFADPRIPLPSEFLSLYPEFRIVGSGPFFIWPKDREFSPLGLQGVLAIPSRFQEMLPFIGQVLRPDGRRVNSSLRPKGGR